MNDERLAPPGLLSFIFHLVSKTKITIQLFLKEKIHRTQ
jgi:hypothetical protein